MQSIILPDIFVISKEGRKFSSKDIHARSQIFTMNYFEFYNHLNSQYGWSIDSPSFDVDLLADSCKIQFLTNERMLIDGNFAHVEFISNLLNQQLPIKSSTIIAKEMKEMHSLQFILHQVTLNYTELTFKPSEDIMTSLEEKFGRNLSYIHHIADMDGEFITFAGIDTANEYHLIHPAMFVRLADEQIQFVDLYAQKIMTQQEFFDFYGDVVGRIVLAGSG